MSVFDEVHDPNVEQRRRTMVYALIVLFAIVVMVAAILINLRLTSAGEAARRVQLAAPEASP